MVFRGTFDYTLDAKNRLTVPARIRSHFTDGAVLARGLKRNVSLWIPSEFEDYVATMLRDFHPLSDEYATLDSHLNGGAHDVELDSAGRIAFAPRLMQYGGITKDVVIVGGTNHLQIWDRGTWDARDEGLPAAVAAITARMSGGGPSLSGLGQS
ncbi:division/cell wall cluster transcriptional repressor MraZ [Paraconexibacter sp.]|uniref:division/cell wall cluster transcriptional repressor MraZ n=1 Tax=Paraconexibacter sp. TaxID=2949640 RepID=UPI003564E707